MTTLTTRQRDLLCLLLIGEQPQGAARMGREVGLSARQVHYHLGPVEHWLTRRGVALSKQPGLGMSVHATPARRSALLNELTEDGSFALVLTAVQRQQLLALRLLTTPTPLILNRLARDIEVSRTTLLKDLDSLGPWLEGFGLRLERRPNVGCLIEGRERHRRQALAALLWGDVPFDPPLMGIGYDASLTFALAQDAARLPATRAAADLVARLDTTAGIGAAARLETECGGRFSDDAVLHLALVLAIQQYRTLTGATARADEKELADLRGSVLWPIASRLAAALMPTLAPAHLEGEVAHLAMILLAAEREGEWPAPYGPEAAMGALVDRLVEQVAARLQLPYLRHDWALRDGLAGHLLPLLARVRYGLWAPQARHTADLTARYARPLAAAREVAGMVAAETGIQLPEPEVRKLALLLRAAFIRERPAAARRVLVVCPAGMATTQLLLARLRARFPRLGRFEVQSIRELGEAALSASDLVISTVPLDLPAGTETPIILVHPLLQAADVEAITRWME